MGGGGEEVGEGGREDPQVATTTGEGMEDQTAFRTRPRRVSFAETTAVRFFKRDEDYETPPEPSTPGSGDCSSDGNECDDNDDNDDNDDHELFVKNVLDSSPGSTIGSQTSNDDYNLFGPVSSSFLRPQGGLDTSSCKDTNHDITLDSATFSMHFRNVIRPDDLSINSVGSRSLNTPTDTISGNVTASAKSKRRPPPPGGVSGSGVNSDMSFVTENRRGYDYEKLPLRLENLLADVDASIAVTSPGSGIKVNPMTVDVASADGGSKVSKSEGSPNCGLVGSPNSNVLPNCQSSPTPRASWESPVNKEGYDQSTGSQNMLHPSPVVSSQFTATIAAEGQKQISVPLDGGGEPHTPDPMPDQHFEGSIASLSGKRRKIFSGPSVSLKNPSVSTRLGGQSAYSSDMEMVKHSQKISAIKSSMIRSKSRLLSPTSCRKHLQSQFEVAFDRKTTVSSPMQDEISCINGVSSDDQLVAVHGRFQPREEAHQLSDDHGIVPVHPTDLIPSSARNFYLAHGNQQDSEASHHLFPFSDVEMKTIGKSTEKLHLINETERGQTKRKSVPEINDRTPLSPLRPFSSAVCTTGIETSTPNWSEIASKIFKIAEKPLSRAVDPISLTEIDIIQDKLAGLQRAKKFERFYLNMQTTMAKNHRCIERERRLAEIKHLQDTLMYEKAKLQMKKLNQDLLLKEKKALQLVLEECHKLKHAAEKSYNSALEKDNLMLSFQHVSTHSTITREEEQNKILSMRQEIKSLEGRLKWYRDFFENSCGIKGNTSFDELIKIGDHQLKQKNNCSLILRNLLMWKIVDFQNGEDQCVIHLNYKNLLDQRFTVKSVPGSGLSFRNTINVANVEKTFPNMKACTAFKFVINSEDNCRLDNLKHLRQQAQTTWIILGNLLDLLWEVQTAYLMIRNLISSNFYSAAQSDQLELELGFVNLRTGRNVTLSLDMSILKSGIYPSVPSELQITIAQGKNVLPSTDADEIMCAIRGLKSGNSVITSICQCVSRFFQ